MTETLRTALIKMLKDAKSLQHSDWANWDEHHPLTFYLLCPGFKRSTSYGPLYRSGYAKPGGGGLVFLTPDGVAAAERLVKGDGPTKTV